VATAQESEEETVRDRIAAGLAAGERPLLDLLHPEASEVFEALDDAWPGTGLSYPTPRFSGTPFAGVAAGFGDAELRAMGLWAHLRRYGTGRDPSNPSLAAATSMVASRKLAWRPDEVEALWQVTLAWRPAEVEALLQAALIPRDTWYREELRLPLAATARLDPDDRKGFGEYLRQAVGMVDRLDMASAERARLKQRIEELLALVDQRPPGEELAALVRGTDAFAAALRADLADELTAPGMPALLRRWGAASAARPTATWARRSRELTAAAPSAVELIRTVLGRLRAHRERVVQHQTSYRHRGRVHHVEWTETVYLDADTAVLLRGMIWSLDPVDEDWVAPLLGDVAVAAGTGIQGVRREHARPAGSQPGRQEPRPAAGGGGADARSELVANAAVRGLGLRPAEAAVAQLARVQAKVRKRTILAGVTKALVAAAAGASLTPEQLLERTVPTFGLGPDGTREEPAGAYTALLAVEAPGAPVLRFRNPAGRVVASVPKAVREGHAEGVAELRAAVKELKQALPGERARVEGALAAGRTWSVGEWRSLYLDHPVTGVFGRALLWEYSADGGSGGTWAVGWPTRDDGWGLADRDGRPLPVGPAATVRLWHPIRAAADEVRAWREWLVDAGIRQPFKQAYREVYLLTPAEEATRSYSNRFGAHILKYGQAKALLSGRGWTGLQLGYWDGGDDTQADKLLHDAATGTRWRARFYLDLIDTGKADGYQTPSYCSSDQVRFERDDGGAWRQTDLVQVPALVLSEALRDVDLAVGVASIAADPAWRDRGETRHLDYWYRWSVGDLTETAKVRREALAMLLPRTRIADRVELTDRFLRVRGDLRSYKIHLGSGNILMEPNDAYLCIVTARDAPAEGVFLPFEEHGGLLSVIVSKAFLLANDAAITDPTIVRQIRG
jgi:hypothetical protein